MAATPESFYVYTSTGGILQLHNATPTHILGLATIDLAPCMALVIVGINGRVSLLHTPRRGIDWDTIKDEVAYIGEGNIEKIYIAHNPCFIDEEDPGYLQLFNYFSEKGQVYPFQAPDPFGGKVVYNRHTKNMKILSGEKLRSENCELYCYTFSLNNYFESTVGLYLHYDGKKWSEIGPTLHWYPSLIYQRTIDFLNEDTEENRIKIKNTILDDIMFNPYELPLFFSLKIKNALDENKIQMVNDFFDHILKCFFIYARNVAELSQQVEPQVGRNQHIFLSPPTPNLRNQEQPTIPAQNLHH